MVLGTKSVPAAGEGNADSAQAEAECPTLGAQGYIDNDRNHGGVA